MTKIISMKVRLCVAFMALGFYGAAMAGSHDLKAGVTRPGKTIFHSYCSVCHGGNFRVQKFDKDEKFISSFGALGRQSGQFSRPKEAAVDPSGNVYVVDASFGNFQIFNPEGKLLMAIGSRSNTTGPARYSLPSGIAADDDGRIYVVEQFFSRVDVFRPIATPEDGGWIGKFNKKTSDTKAGDANKSPAAQPSANSAPATSSDSAASIDKQPQSAPAVEPAATTESTK